MYSLNIASRKTFSSEVFEEHFNLDVRHYFQIVSLVSSLCTALQSGSVSGAQRTENQTMLKSEKLQLRRKESEKTKNSRKAQNGSPSDESSDIPLTKDLDVRITIVTFDV